MPRKTHRRKEDVPKPSSQLNGLQPDCDGPKLNAFAYRKAPIEYIRQLSDPDRDGQSYVFEVTIAEQPYALKIFKFYDDGSDLEALYDGELDRIGLKTLHAHSDPFFNECRAYGKLIDSSLNGRVAVRCHGYTTLHFKEVYQLGARFHIEDLEEEAESYRWNRVPPENSLYRAIVKDLIRDDLPLTHMRVKRMRRDLLKMRALGIYPMDIRLSNYRAALLIDFGTAITEPHYTFEISPEWQNVLTRNTDLIEFDEMVEKAAVKTWVKAWNKRYLEKLRPRGPSLENHKNSKDPEKHNYVTYCEIENGKADGKTPSGIRYRQSRRSSTFRTASGRTLLIKTTDTPTSTSSCDCTYQFPQGLEIDRSRPLINTVGSYNQHVVIATGKNDWESRIENEERIGDMARALKDRTKRTGECNSSFVVDPTHLGTTVPTKVGTATSQLESPTTTTSINLFPHFLHFPLVANTPTHQNHLTSTYLNDQTLSPTSNPSPLASFVPPLPITKPTILICSHGSRDARCGVLGPLLHNEFLELTPPETVDVAMISHIGGHAFAGNVIVYIPPEYRLAGGGQLSPLAGMGIWYGRVEPGHVKSIVEETVEKGNILGGLWRGGLDVDVRGRGAGDWRARTASARVVRVPHGVAEDGAVLDEKREEGQGGIDVRQRVEMMGARARERRERGRTEGA
ncbi:MAG: hypothetical protein Q9170_002927 [Blastenia crenularia]